MSKAKKEALPSSRVVDLTLAAIAKLTGQKPMSMDLTTIPHVPTGSITLDLLIGGSPSQDGKGQICPGIPRQRITEIYGAESSGKTTAAICAAAQTQRNGGVVMYLDFEHSLHHGYAKACGLSFDRDKLMLYQPETLEQGFSMIWVGIRAGVDLIIVDSVAAMVPAAEMDKKVEDNAKIGAVAKKLSELLPKVVIWLKGRNIEGEDGSTKTEEGKTALLLINQTRALISTGGHSAETESTSGGKALKFFLSVRLKMTRIRSDFVERKDELTLKKKKIPYGNLVQVKVVKNKLDARQGQTGEVFIRYGFGIDDYHSIIESAAARRIVKKEGSMYTYENLKFRGKDAFRAHLLSEPKTFEALRSKVVDAMLSTSVVVTGDVDEDDIVSGDEDSILDGAEEALGGLEETVESEES